MKPFLAFLWCWKQTFGKVPVILAFLLNVFAILPVLCLFCRNEFSFSLFFVLQRLWMMSLRRWRRRESGRYTWISPSFLLKNIKHCEHYERLLDDSFCSHIQHLFVKSKQSSFSLCSIIIKNNLEINFN